MGGSRADATIKAYEMGFLPIAAAAARIHDDDQFVRAYRVFTEVFGALSEYDRVSGRVSAELIDRETFSCLGMRESQFRQIAVIMLEPASTDSQENPLRKDCGSSPGPIAVRLKIPDDLVRGQGAVSFRRAGGGIETASEVRSTGVSHPPDSSNGLAAPPEVNPSSGGGFWLTYGIWMGVLAGVVIAPIIVMGGAQWSGGTAVRLAAVETVLARSDRGQNFAIREGFAVSEIQILGSSLQYTLEGVRSRDAITSTVSTHIENGCLIGRASSNRSPSYGSTRISNSNEYMLCNGTDDAFYFIRRWRMVVDDILNVPEISIACPFLPEDGQCILTDETYVTRLRAPPIAGSITLPKNAPNSFLPRRARILHPVTCGLLCSHSDIVRVVLLQMQAITERITDNYILQSFRNFERTLLDFERTQGYQIEPLRMSVMSNYVRQINSTARLPRDLENR